MSTDIIPFSERVGALSVRDVRDQVQLIQSIMQEVMKRDEHYGVIPGTGTKPSLLKAGAEKLCLTFRLDPEYEIEQKQEGLHLNVVSKCTLYHIPSGQRYGSGMGSCSTREAKYAYRQSSVKCPACGKEAIIKGKDFKNDGKPTGWLCYAKKGGCGTKFLDGDQQIEGQPRGRVANEDIADQYNTVLKMANKRSLVAAVLNATAASDIFTQDIEDMAPVAEKEVKAEEPLKIAQEQIEAIHTAMAECGVTMEAVLAKAEIKDLKDMASDDAMGAIRWIRKQKKAA